MQTVGRNSPCPCGSGKKAKRCCGQLEADTTGAGGAAGPVGPDAQCRHAGQLIAQGRVQEAIDILETVASRKPDFAPALFTLAQALWMQGSLESAAARLRAALALEPKLAEGHNNLGILYDTLGRSEAAVESFAKALAIKPDFALAHSNLGNALRMQGKPAAAIASLRRAIAIDPARAEFRANLANLQSEEGDLDAAVASFRSALSLRPGYAAARQGLAAAQLAQGDTDAAIASFREVLALGPEQTDAHSGLLFSMNIDPRVSPAERLAEARRYGSAVAARARPFERWAFDVADASIGRSAPLRVGIVSGDLRAHPVGFFIESVLAQVDPSRLEFLAYSTLPQEDALTARIKPRFAAWTRIAGLDDEAAAARIRADGVHVLIDMAGHTADNSLPLFAWKPAPVQATWLGYFGTTGVAAIDYLLADPVSVPRSRQDQFTEALWRLPDGRFCFTPPADAAQYPVAPLPALRGGGFTFGCFQAGLKLNDAVLAAWGRILRALPGARLRIQNAAMGYVGARSALLERLARAGIAADRVALFGRMPREEYLRAHADVDIILDTFPYTGATTTCEALWMGVPTLTLAGDTLASRQGASLLASTGLDDWIAADEDDYVARAIALASAQERLARLRADLRERALASPLFDAERFARNLERALLGMWQRKAGHES